MASSARIAATVPAGPDRRPRIPACAYRFSAEIFRPRAICARISADGLRSPRSTCDRHGLLTPAVRASSRSDPWAALRWVRMNPPTCEPTAGTEDATLDAPVEAPAAADWA